MMCRNVRIRVGVVGGLLGLSALGAIALNRPLAPISGDRGLSLSTTKQFPDDVLAEAMLGLTQTLVNEAGREVRVLVTALGFSRRGKRLFSAQGFKTVEAATQAPVESKFSFGDVKCRLVVRPRQPLTWKQVSSRHDVEISLQP